MQRVLNSYRAARVSRILLTFLILATAHGCRDNGGRVPVYGTVKLEGLPLDEGRILFTPTNGTQGPAAGTEVISGEYSISTSDGPTPGSYLVTVTPGGPPSKTNVRRSSQPAPKVRQPYVLTRTVAENGGQLDFEFP